MASSKPKRSQSKRQGRNRSGLSQLVSALSPIWAKFLRALPWAFLLGAIIFGCILRVYGAADNPGINSDEGISLLAATGHEGEYNAAFTGSLHPFATWCESAEWRRFILPEESFCFGTISSDLVKHDTHPPLYFWILHVWLLIWGVHPWTALTLNLIFFAISAVGLFLIGVYAFRRRLEAAAAVLIWSCSPTVMPVAYEARQYELLALCTIWFTLMVLRCASRSRPPKTWHWIVLGLISGAGLLTHYHFVIALAGGTVYTLFRLVRHHRRRMATGLLSIYIGVGAVHLVHPAVSHIWSKASGPGSRSVDASARLQSCYRTYRSFVMVDVQQLSASASQQYARVLPYAFLGLCGAMAALAWRRRSAEEASGDSKDALVGSLLFFLIWYAASNIGLYASGVSPRHAMMAKYPCMAWPFLALLLVILTRPLLRFRLPVQLLLCIAMVVSGSLHVRWDITPTTRLSDEFVQLAWGKESLVVGNANRLRLPRLLFRLGDDVHMYVAPRKTLLATYDDWAGGLGERGRYLGYNGSGGMSGNLEALFNRLWQDFTYENEKRGVVGYNIYIKLTQR